jgi:hypothetical protein
LFSFQLSEVAAEIFGNLVRNSIDNGVFHFAWVFQHGLTSMDRASTRKLLEQRVPVTDESNSQRSFEATHVHQFENSNTSRMLASRALEELARTPSRSASK